MRRLVILFALVGIVAAYLFLWDLPRERQRVEKDAIERQLMIFQPSRVDTLRVDRAGGRMTLARDGDAWWILEPVREQANAPMVETHLQALADAERVRPLDDEVATDNLEVYGLDSVGTGMALVRVASRDGTTATLRVGNLNPSGTATYVQRSPEAPVELAQADLATLVHTQHHAFRVYDLFAAAESTIVALAVDAGDASYSARRRDNGLWYLDEPDGRRLRRWLVRNLTYDLATTRIRAFVADGLTEGDWSGYGLHEPLADVRFEAGDGVVHRIRVGNESDEQMVFGRRDDESTLFILPPQLLATAETPLEDLIDTSPLEFNFDELDSLRIFWENGPDFGIARAGEDWEARPRPSDPQAAESLRTPIRNVLYGLERTQSLGSMLLAPGATAQSVLEQHPVRCRLHWPDQVVEITLGWQDGEADHWLYVEGGREMARVPRDLFFRLRGCLVSAGLLDF